MLLANLLIYKVHFNNISNYKQMLVGISCIYTQKQVQNFINELKNNKQI